MSVIVVNWNRRELLKKCLQSIEQQQDTSFEVILVDNGSTDGSIEAALPFAEGLSLRIIENPNNLGFCAANNQGILAARGEFVALLNNDAEADPGWLKALLTAFDGRPGTGMAASKILVYEDPGVIDKAGHLIYLDGQNRGRGSGQRDNGQFDTPEEVCWPDGCACMYRKSMLDLIGGFDEDLFAYADDAELGLRARIAGWDCWYVPSATVRHHRGSTLGVMSPRRVELIERNRVLLAVKLFPWSLLWLNAAYYLARIAAGTWAAVRGKGEVRRFPGPKGKLTLISSLIKADLEAVRMIPRMYRKRKEVDKIRRLSPAEVRALLIRYRIRLRELMEQAV